MSPAQQISNAINNCEPANVIFPAAATAAKHRDISIRMVVQSDLACLSLADMCFTIIANPAKKQQQQQEAHVEHACIYGSFRYMLCVLY